MDTRICRLHAAGDIRIETQPVARPGPGEAMVAIAAGGICGSDLHYYQHGGFGPIRVQEPIILGHEASGTVIEVGPDITSVTAGTRVAVNPSRPCGDDCIYCRENLAIHCLNMRFSGSAMRMPHEQGLFRDRVIVGAAQCVPIGDDVSFTEAACAEPLAVCLHACNRAGDLKGKRVIVTGAGPIGALCAAVSAEAGAAEVVVTDLQDFTLDVVRRMGATRVINVATNAADLDAYAADKGHFDVAFECSGAAPAIRSAVAVLRPRGRLVQVGIAGDVAVPLNFIVSKEISFIGTQRFDTEFNEAVTMISERRIDLGPLVTGTFPLEEAEAAFRAAGDRTSAVKVHIGFDDDA